jgi:hypothetical protein
MRLTVVPLREAEPDQAIQPRRPDPAVAPYHEPDKLSTARGFVFGIAIGLAGWAAAGAVILWLVI